MERWRYVTKQSRSDSSTAGATAPLLTVIQTLPGPHPNPGQQWVSKGQHITWQVTCSLSFSFNLQPLRFLWDSGKALGKTLTHQQGNGTAEPRQSCNHPHRSCFQKCHSFMSKCAVKCGSRWRYWLPGWPYCWPTLKMLSGCYFWRLPRGTENAGPEAATPKPHVLSSLDRLYRTWWQTQVYSHGDCD